MGPSDPRPRWWTWPTTTQIFEAPTQLKLTAILSHRHAAHELALHPPKVPAGESIAPGDDHTGECRSGGKAEIFFPSPVYAIPKATVARFGLVAECSNPTYFQANAKTCNLADGTHFQSNGDIMVATESFSSEAAEAIKARGYNQGFVLRTLLNDKTAIVPGLPATFVDTKHMYWPIKAQGVSALPVYRDIAPNRGCQYNGYETWDALVGVDPSATAPGKGKVDFLFGVYSPDGKSLLPTKHADVDVYPLDRFYAQRVDKATWDAMDRNDQMLLDAASEWAYGQPFAPGDYVATVAMHITTKEIPQWTFQSLWWSDHPDDGRYATDRPALPDAHGPWKSYLLTSEYGIPDESRPGGKSLPIAFNPFIELAATHPVATNCRNCHFRAGVTTGAYLTNAGPGPLADIKETDPMFKGLLLTDTSWVMADRVEVPATP